VSAASCLTLSKLRAKRITPPTSGCTRCSISASESTRPSTPSITGPRGRFGISAVRPRRLGQQRLHLPHGFAQAHEYRAGDDRVSDMQLAHARNRGDGLHVEIIERVPRIETHSRTSDRLAGDANPFELGDDG